MASIFSRIVSSPKNCNSSLLLLNNTARLFNCLNLNLIRSLSFITKYKCKNKNNHDSSLTLTKQYSEIVHYSSYSTTTKTAKSKGKISKSKPKPEPESTSTCKRCHDIPGKINTYINYITLHYNTNINTMYVSCI